MSWFFLSLGCAFFSATTAALAKLILRKNDEFFVLWTIYLFSLPLFLIAFFHAPKPHLTPTFWKTVAILLPLEIAAFLMYLRALKFSPLSLVLPFLGLTPAFIVLTSFIVLKERLSLYGIGGVILVSLGAYLLNANRIKDGVLVPFKNIYREKGSRLMIFVAFIYSITSVLGKKAVLLSNPECFPAIYYSIFFAVITPVACVKIRKANIALGKKDFFLFIVLGILFGTSILFHFKAISLVNVSYMISVKRLSLILGVCYGAIIFKEKNIAYRMLGSLVMLGGVLLLSLGG